MRIIDFLLFPRRRESYLSRSKTWRLKIPAFAGMTLLLGLLAQGVCAAESPVKKYGQGGPIEITADTLEVRQQENIAVFTGHVVAIQGKLRLKSDKMTVHYINKEEGAAKSQKPEDSQSIERIEVEGDVFLTTPEETASGISGVYDVTGQNVTLNKNVVLTRGKNTLKGDKLVYDFKTGRSVVTGGATVTEGGKKERVRALLIPDENKDKKQP